MAFCYAAGAVGLLVLMVSVSLWHFWIAALLHVILMINGSVGSALVTDLVPRESLGRGMSLFGATGWVGGVIGFAGAGYAIQNLGMVTTFVIGLFLTLIATLLLIPIRQFEQRKQV